MSFDKQIIAVIVLTGTSFAAGYYCRQPVVENKPIAFKELSDGVYELTTYPVGPFLTRREGVNMHGQNTSRVLWVHDIPEGLPKCFEVRGSYRYEVAPIE